MKTTKIIYWIATALLCLLMLASAGMYIFNHAEVAKIFISLGYPTYIIYPLAIAKIGSRPKNRRAALSAVNSTCRRECPLEASRKRYRIKIIGDSFNFKAA